MKLSKESANKFLSFVSEQNKFWCNDGSAYSNLVELEDGLNKMNQEAFNFHANKEKNDFSNWIYDIIGDVNLANNLRKCKDKKSAQKKVKTRIVELKNIIA